MFNELIVHSKNGFCFVENHDNYIIPMKDCCVDTKFNPSYIHGMDFLNNRDVKIKIEDIKAYIHIESDTHNFYKKFSTHYKKLQDICTVEKIPLDNPFLYKNLPIWEKVVSFILNKDYNEVSLEELKDLWITYIEKYCNNFENYITVELNESSNALYKAELLNIKNDLVEIKKFKEIKEFTDKKQLSKYWPTILMPAPSFVDF